MPALRPVSALQDPVPIQCPVDGIEDGFFVGTPEWSDQIALCPVAGQPVNDHRVRDQRDAPFQDIDVLILREGVYTAGFVFPREIRSFQDVQQLQLDSVGPSLSDVSDRLAHILRRFSRKPQDQMGDDFDSPRFQGRHRLIIDGTRISAPDIFCRFFVDGLKAQLDPHRFFMA